MSDRRPDGVRLVLATAAALAGGVWVLQGLGVPLGGSFMVGDVRWAVIGGVVVVAAAVALARELRPRG